MRKEHGCLYNTFGLLVLYVIAQALSPQAGTIMALLLVGYVLFSILSGMFQSDPFAAQERTYWKEMRMSPPHFDSIYEVTDGVRKAQIPARSANDAQFRFVSRYGGMVELTYVRKVQ